MLYKTSQAWAEAPHKNILFFGMSGLGKTHLSKLLRAQGDWYHYSIDYRIGTRYMGEHITDNLKLKAMEVPFLRDLLLSDSIRITSKIRFENLDPLSTYLGKPGNPAQNGLPIEEYRRRQSLFKSAEISALMDTGQFITRAQNIYNYPHFICDSGGSICEWIDKDLGAKDPIISELQKRCLLVWLKGDEDHAEKLVKRFDHTPKPMAYQPEFLRRKWNEYLNEFNVKEDEVNPDSFIRWTYAQALEHRQPLYAHMARFGVTLNANDVAQVQTPEQLEHIIATAIDAA